jgi:hypothetical protein
MFPVSIFSNRIVKILGLTLAGLFSGCLVFGDSSNILVRVGGRLRSAFEIEQLVVGHARQAKMQFDFNGASQPYFTVLSNGPSVISMGSAQTNGSYFCATVDSKGVIRAQELTPQDAEAIRALLAIKTTNAVTQVWLGPDGRVGATTLRSGKKDEGELFWLKHVRSRWTIEDLGIWKVSPPVIRATDFHAS